MEFFLQLSALLSLVFLLAAVQTEDSEVEGVPCVGSALKDVCAKLELLGLPLIFFVRVVERLLKVTRGGL